MDSLLVFKAIPSHPHACSTNEHARPHSKRKNATTGVHAMTRWMPVQGKRKQLPMCSPTILLCLSLRGNLPNATAPSTAHHRTKEVHTKDPTSTQCGAVLLARLRGGEIAPYQRQLVQHAWRYCKPRLRRGSAHGERLTAPMLLRCGIDAAIIWRTIPYALGPHYRLWRRASA